MKEQKKQSLLNVIIVILVIVLVMLVGSIVYEEKINMSKQPIQNTNAPAANESTNNGKDEENNDEEQQKDETIVVEDETENTLENDSEEEQPSTETDNREEFVGEEENKTQKEPEMTTDEKVIDLVKKEWGNDGSVTFTIEKKNGTKYRVAVRDSSTTVLQWYEVNTESWEVSEY